MRKIAISLTTALLISSSNLNAGIPVVDGAANTLAQLQLTNMITEYAQTAIRYAEQLNTWKQETIDRAKEYYAKTGIKDSIQTIEDVYDTYNELSSDIMDVVDTVNSLGNLDFSNEAIGMAKKVFGSEICNDINPLISYELKMQCYRAYAGSFETLRILNRQTNETAKDIEKLNELAFKLKKSQDIKESADIANAIEITKARIEKKKEYTEQALAMIKEQERVEQKKYEQAMLREQFNEKLKLDFKVN